MLDTIHIVKKLNAANSDAVASVVADIQNWAAARAIDIIEENFDEHTLFVAIGGDGTVIHAAKKALDYGAPVLGFNLGKVGFLADFEVKNVQATLHAAFEDMLEADDRLIISIDGGNGLPKFMALNEFVISCKYSDTTFPYDLFVNRSYAGSHTANGVIISTPTGSTAYSLSVGGAIIMPAASEVLQIVPIAAQTLTSRPLIVPAGPGVSIKFPYTKDRPVTIRADGQVIWELTANDDQMHFQTITVEPVPMMVTLLHHNSWNHFDVLNKKLNWNK